MERGVRQGCWISPDFFNLYSKLILGVLKDVPEGVAVNRVRRRMVPSVCFKWWKPQAKTGIWASAVRSRRRCAFPRSKRNQPLCSLVSSSKYLGATIPADSRRKKKIRRRTGMAKVAFNKMRAIFSNCKLSFNIKLHLITTLVWLVLARNRGS